MLQALPAAFGVLPEGVLEPGRGGDLAVLEKRRVLVALEVQRRDHTLIELGALLQYGLRRFQPGVFKTGQLRHLVDAGQVLNVEQHVFEGCGVAHGVSRNQIHPRAAARHPLKGAQPAARRSRFRGCCWMALSLL